MKARLIGIVLLLGLGALVAVRVRAAREQETRNAAAQAAAPAAAPPVLVRATPVQVSDLDERVEFTGNVRPVAEVDVFAKMPGRVVSLQAQVGDVVRAGQVLAEVEHKELDWQERTVEAQKRTAQAAVEAARAGVAGAELEFERTQKLHEGGSAPEAALDGARIKLKAARAQLHQAQAAVGQAEAGAGLVGQQIENARIEAPIAGVIVKRMVQLGGMVGPQAPVFTIQDTSSLKIEASVEPSVFLRLQKGAPAAISADGMAGKTFPARVSVLAPTLDPASRRAAVELALDPGTQLIPNMFVRASVAVGRVPGARTIPREAVLDRAGNTVVYKVVDGRAVAVPLRLGPSDGARIAVEEGLAPGDSVVVGGLGQLSDGAAVRVNPE